MKKNLILIFLLPWFFQHSLAQPINSAEILLGMQRLNVLGSVLYFAAHPDDENTKLIAYLASEQKVKTSYLSLTRGDGGQNLIGNELGIDLGLIRTHELLEARKIDQGEQYFTSALDFGFSKTHEETFQFWNKTEVLRESVYLIRKLRPDIIITRFPPDERGGHGHHQASAILAHDAYLAAADPNMFPEQLEELNTWQATRLIWNTSSFFNMQGDTKEQLEINIGQYNPLLGKSYGEISALSRSQHKSQGFGTAASNGDFIEGFQHVLGEKATTDLFDGIDISWSRIDKSKSIQDAINKLLNDYKANKPEHSIKQLAKIWYEIQHIKDNYWRQIKSKEVEDLIIACSGIKVESISPQLKYVQGDTIQLETEIIVRSAGVTANLVKINNESIHQSLSNNTLYKRQHKLLHASTTQPYWLKLPINKGNYQISPDNFGQPLNADLPKSTISLEIESIPLQIVKKIYHRHVDPVRGEIHTPIEIVPALTAKVDKNNLLLKSDETSSFELNFQNHRNENKEVHIALNSSTPGWTIQPTNFTINFQQGQPYQSKTILITNNTAEEPAHLTFAYENKPITSFREIEYEHINKQTWFPPLEIKAEPIAINNPVEKVGYIMGAGDMVPEALRLIGIQVDLLDIGKITLDILNQYDALVFGVRAMNTNKQIPQKLPIIYDYVRKGGVVVMQYNVNSGLVTEKFAPIPLNITRSRVTEEDATVQFLNPDDPVLNFPNKITEKDFENWIQERGLYFAETKNVNYRTPIAMNDKNEPPHSGSLLISRIGEGKFVYTSLSFFRQLPAGIAGANRLFVNLLTKEN